MPPCVDASKPTRELSHYSDQRHAPMSVATRTVSAVTTFHPAGTSPLAATLHPPHRPYPTTDAFRGGGSGESGALERFPAFSE